MENDLVSYNHAQIRIWVHISFKVKFTHEVFDIREFREACQKQMDEIFSTHKIECDRIGFDSNHFHAIVDLARWDITTLVKVIKGTSGKKLLEQFPEIKKKYFWGSGLWGRQYYCYSIGSDMNMIQNYIKKQKFFTIMQDKEQTNLMQY